MKAGYNTIPSIEEGESQSLIDNVEILEAEEGSRGYTNKKKIRFALVLLAISFLICYRTIMQHSGLQMSKESKELVVNNSSEQKRPVRWPEEGPDPVSFRFCRKSTDCWTRSKNNHCPFFMQKCAAALFVLNIDKLKRDVMDVQHILTRKKTGVKDTMCP